MQHTFQPQNVPTPTKPKAKSHLHYLLIIHSFIILKVGYDFCPVLLMYWIRYNYNTCQFLDMYPNRSGKSGFPFI